MARIHELVVELLYRLRLYRLAYRHAGRHLPPHHWLNFHDEPDVE